MTSSYSGFATHRKRRQQSKASGIKTDYMSILEADGYVVMDRLWVDYLFHFFDTDLAIQTAFNTLMNIVLAAGIHVVFPDYELSEAEQNASSLTLSKWCRDILRSVFVTGCFGRTHEVDPVHKFRPICVNLNMIDVTFKLHPTEKIKWKLYERMENNFNLTSVMPKELKGITMVCVNMPTGDGLLTSKIASLIDDKVMEDFLAECNMSAEKVRSTPLLVTENIVPKYNTDVEATKGVEHQTVDKFATAQSQGAPTYHSNVVGPASLDAQTVQEIKIYKKNEEMMHSSDRTSFDWSNSIRKAQKQKYEPYRLELETNLKLAKQTLPEPPSTYLHILESRPNRVFTAFGIPSSLAKNMRNQSKGASNRSNVGNATANDDISMTVFLHTQKQLKTDLICYIKELYMDYNFDEKLMKRVNKNRLEKKQESDLDVIHNSLPHITISSIPDDTVADKLFVSGMLKYDAYKLIQSQKYGINIDDFEDKPKLNLKELNNIKEEKPAIGTAAKKPKTKAK